MEGKVAIIHLDPSDSFIYDVLRYWRLQLSKEPDLGAAGQSLLLLGALPSGKGFDSLSLNLYSVSKLIHLYCVSNNDLQSNFCSA